MVGSFSFFRSGIWIALAHRRDQAWIVRSEDFNNRIACTQFIYAVGNAVTPSLSVPINPQRRIAVPIVGSVDIGLHARNGINKFANTIHPARPFGIEFL